MKKTKIICTLGPSSDKPETIQKMLQAGMNVARMNFSHGSHEEQKGKMDTFKKVRSQMDIPAAIMLDTKGPEIRLRDFEAGKVVLEDGQKFTLYCTEQMGSKEGAAVSYHQLWEDVEAGNTILIDDGKVHLQVDEVKATDIVCTVIHGGKISDKKGVNIPNKSLNIVYLSEQDKKDILFGISQDVDYIAASFVRSAQDVRDLRQFLKANGGENIQIISKIENNEGIENFEEILEVTDGVMVARGDMGVEVEYDKLPGIQKKLIKACNKAGKFVITATQMLESMTSEPTPTRAEITDVANAVFDGTSAVMTSGETAAGDFPVEVVETMAAIVTRAEEDAAAFNQYRYLEVEADKSDVSNAIGHAACTTARDIDAAVIIALTTSGYTARKMAKYEPKKPIIAVTPKFKVYNQLAMIRGVYPVLTDAQAVFGDMVEDAHKGAVRMGVASEGDLAVITAGFPLGKSGATNMIKVETIK